MAQEKPRLRKLVPSLGVSDIQRSTAFYREFFGFEIVDAADDADGNPLWCWLRSGVAELMLQQLTAEQQITLEPALGQSWVLYLRPVDIDDMRARLLAADVEISDVMLSAYGARECFAKDPDGYELWLSVPEEGRGEDDDDDDDDDTDDDASDAEDSTVH